MVRLGPVFFLQSGQRIQPDLFFSGHLFSSLPLQAEIQVTLSICAAIELQAVGAVRKVAGVPFQGFYAWGIRGECSLPWGEGMEPFSFRADNGGTGSGLAFDS